MAELKEEEENDLFDKLAEKGVITSEMKKKLYEMRGFRNIVKP